MSKSFEFDAFDKEIEASLARNKRVIQDLFSHDEEAFRAMLQESVDAGVRTPEEMDAELIDFKASELAEELGGAAVQASANFYD